MRRMFEAVSPVVKRRRVPRIAGRVPALHSGRVMTLDPVCRFSICFSKLKRSCHPTVTAFLGSGRVTATAVPRRAFPASTSSVLACHAPCFRPASAARVSRSHPLRCRAYARPTFRFSLQARFVHGSERMNKPDPPGKAVPETATRGDNGKREGVGVLQTKRETQYEIQSNAWLGSSTNRNRRN